MAAVVGLKNINIVKLLKDDADTLIYDAVIKKIAGAINAKISPKASTEKLYFDDKLGETATTIGEIEVELEVADLLLDERAFITGAKIVNGVLREKSTDTPPELALGFQSQKSDGTVRYMWLTKGKAEPVEDEAETKGDKVKFQTKKIKLVFMPRVYDEEYRLVADEGMEGFDPSTWFTIDTLTGKPTITPPIPPIETPEIP